MHNKILYGFVIFSAILFFSYSFCFATDNSLLQDAANGAKNVVGGAENAIEGAAKGIANTSRDMTQKAENGAQNISNDIMSSNNENNYGNYNAVRTSAEADSGTWLGMNSTTWTWLIIAVAAVGIIAIVYYYSAQLTENRSND